MPQFEASVQSQKYNPRGIIYTHLWCLQYRCHLWWLSVDDCNVFIVLATGLIKLHLFIIKFLSIGLHHLLSGSEYSGKRLYLAPSVTRWQYPGYMLSPGYMFSHELFWKICRALSLDRWLPIPEKAMLDSVNAAGTVYTNWKGRLWQLTS